MRYQYHKKQQSKPRRGFTLVETLVAITILLVAIVGPMTIAARGLQTAFYAREQIIAFSLAQEGVELIRKIRDENALNPVVTDWLANIPAACRAGGGCGLDARGTASANCSTSSNCQLKYDSGSLSNNRGFYTYAPGTLTPFTRKIWLLDEPTGPGREIRVIVEVSWQSGLFAGPKKVTVLTRLFNQYNNI